MDWEAFYNRFREPDFVPGYEIQNRLGGGAFGEVYKARKHSIGKAYAIKFLKIDDDLQRDAVEHELEAVRHFAAIDHQNLVTIEDLGTVLGVPYLIMGYAGEDTLARRLKQGGIDPEKALSYFVQTCRGVVALHDRRLVHFDLKPSNVFLKGDSARVGDYGLAKMMADGRTTLSFGRGTPQYMAPEMLRNRADHRADIYSLGVILYELFARKLPFESAVPGALALRESDDPPPFPPEYPAGLRHVVERCLRVHPEDRYADVGELLVEMGQTARPGDSVRVDTYRNKTTPTSPPPSRRPSSTRVEGATTESRTSDARSAARELTRGAVEVARGMWDGLRTGAENRGTDDATPRTPPRIAQSQTATPQTATPHATTPNNPEPRTPTPSSGTTANADSDGADRRATPSREARDVVSLHTLASDGRNLMLPPPLPLLAGPEMTIPVPPRVAGGWFGTVFSAIALSLEVLFTVARGLLRLTFEFLARLFRPDGAGRGFVRGVGRVFVAIFKVSLFVLALFLLGGLATLAAFFLLKGAA